MIHEMKVLNTWQGMARPPKERRKPTNIIGGGGVARYGLPSQLNTPIILEDPCQI